MLRRTPTAALLLGLVVTLATVLVYSFYISRQITGLRQLQTDLTDRNRTVAQSQLAALLATDSAGDLWR